MAAIALVACCAGLVIATAPGSAKATVRWHGCPDGYPKNVQCASVSVPRDYDHPRGAQITIGFDRLRATNRAHRVGSLIVNPGGPGGPGSQVVAVEAAGRHLWHPALHRRFDMIGMDPRGIGLSRPSIKCDPAPYNRPVSLFPDSQAQFDQLAAWARAFGASCRRLTGPLLGHVDTLSVARDMEAVRKALGQGKLNFLGLSYGAEMGTLYAEHYPKRIRAMALDAILDHTIPVNKLVDDATRAYEDTLNRVAAWCAQTSSCPLHGQDLLALFDQLTQQADHQPLPAPQCDRAPCRGPVTGDDIRMNAFNLMLVKQPVAALGIPGWADFAGALAQAAAGDASAFATPLATSPRDDPFPALGVNCADYPHTFGRTFGQISATMARSRMLAPHTQGAGETWLGLTGCLRWPVPAANPPHRLQIRGAPPILLVNATHDPSTPYVWAQDVHAQVPRSILLTRDGDGHTSSFLGPGSRTNDAIARFLITRKAPPPGTVLPN
ncbi:MAG TPA: alpha/beta hydrolase [Conexibacter sp.]